jgi:hypothetical protein
MKQITEPPADILKSRPECPEELAATIMRCLEKDPESRWPTADALRRALETRTSVPYRPSGPARRPGEPRAAKPPARPEPRGRQWREWMDDGSKYPARRDRRDRPAARPRAQPARGSDESEPEIVRKFRGQFASYVSVNGSLLLLNIVTGLESPWFLFPAIGWGIGLASHYGRLWSAGYSWRDVINRPPAKDAIEAPKQKVRGKKQIAAAEPSTGDYGKYTSQLRQVKNDQRAIVQIVDKLPDSERKLLPDIIPTVDSLVKRALELGNTLNQMEGEVETERLARLDRQIEELQTQQLDKERQRRLDLLQRQSQTLTDLVERRVKVEAQFESCILAVQNMRFDLLRLRSAGVSEVLDDLTVVTQQAKALSIDVNAAIDAAGEIRAELGRGSPRT